MALAVLLALAAEPSFALDVAERIVAELKVQGYSNIEVSRTLLGRTRITAESPDFDREIVIDPRTGEILRDYWQPLTLDASASANSGLIEPVEVEDSSGSGSSGSGSNSGSGSSGSNSGSGSSGSNSGSGGSGSNSGSGGSGSNSGSGGSGSGGSGSGGSGSGGHGSGGSGSGSGGSGSGGGSGG